MEFAHASSVITYVANAATKSTLSSETMKMLYLSDRMTTLCGRRLQNKDYGDALPALRALDAANRRASRNDKVRAYKNVDDEASGQDS